MKTVVLVLIVAFFGIPFLVISDLFPFHRYGMFARIPKPETKPARYSIWFKMKEKPKQIMETGNAYFDQNYFPLWAESAFSDQAKANDLVARLLKTIPVEPDSIFLVQIQQNDSITRSIFPNP